MGEKLKNIIMEDLKNGHLKNYKKYTSNNEDYIEALNELQEEGNLTFDIIDEKDGARSLYNGESENIRITKKGKEYNQSL